MTDRFDKYLEKFRKRINQGDLQKLKEDLASGRIAIPAKVKAAKFAIQEASELAYQNNEVKTFVPMEQKLEAELESPDKSPKPNKVKNIRGAFGKPFSKVFKFFSKVWRDPVCSKLIAAGLLLIIGFAYQQCSDVRSHREPVSEVRRDVIKVGNKEVYELKVGNLTIKTQEENLCSNDKPITVPKLFECDFVDIGHTNVTFHNYHLKSGNTVQIKAKKFRRYDENTTFLSFYIPNINMAYDTAMEIAEKYVQFLDEIEKRNGIEAVKTPGDSDRVETKDLINSKRVFIYHQDELTTEQTYSLKKTYEARGLFLILRGNNAINANLAKDVRENTRNIAVTK